VLEWAQGAGRVKVHGEIWQARGPAELAPGRMVRITAIHGLTLEVEPQPGAKAPWPVRAAPESPGPESLEPESAAPESPKPESLRCRSSSTTP